MMINCPNSSGLRLPSGGEDLVEAFIPRQLSAGDRLSVARRRTQFSTITTAPSMMMPKSSAPRLIRLALMPVGDHAGERPSMASGSPPVMTAARMLPRKRNRMATTSSAPRPGS